MGRLLVVTGDFPVASETFIVAHIRGMIERGWEVGVCAGTIDRSEVERLFGKDAPVTFTIEMRAQKLWKRSGLRRRLAMNRAFGKGRADWFPPSGGNRMHARARVLWEIARDFRPDAIHCEFGFQGPFAAPVARALKLPLLITYRGNDFIHFPLKHGWEIYSRFPETAVAIGHTEFCENLLRRHLPCRVVHVRRGVNRGSFNPPERRREWGDTVRLVVVGRWRFFKGHHLALEAMALLRKLRPEVRFELALVGGGDENGLMARKADVLGLTGRIRATGMLPPAQVGDELRRADIHLVPSCAGAEGFVENFATVCSEGLASGLPVVASNHGGIPETVEGHGVLVPGGSAFELARGILHVIDTGSPASWAERALAGSRRFSDEDMMDDFERATINAIESSHD